MSFFSEYNEVKRLLQQKNPVVFYAESRHYYQYFKRLVEDLLKENVPVCYITSDKKDGLLTSALPGMKVIYVKWMLGFLFPRLQSDVMVMTMPDLGNNAVFKRSGSVKNYVYVFHAAVSVHQQYNRDAFFKYDTIFCTGDYQEKEIRKMEELYNQPEKEIIRYGYPLFDVLRNSKKESHSHKRILVAPSWFQGCIFDTCIAELLEKLSVIPYEVIIRFHPEFEKRRKKEFRQVEKIVDRYSNMSVDNEPNVSSSLPSADILITDRSGIALEFAFGIQQPVLFIDTALKETNKEWSKLEIEPIENRLRTDMGLSIKTNELDKLGDVIKRIEAQSGYFGKEADRLLKELFYNSEPSYLEGVHYIQSQIKQ